MPVFNNLSTSNAQYVYGEEPHRLAGRRMSHELSCVSAGEEKARGDLIAAHQQVFDRAMEVGNGTSKCLRSVEQTFRALRSACRQCVVAKIVVHRSRGVLRIPCIPERIKQTCGLNHL